MYILCYITYPSLFVLCLMIFWHDGCCLFHCILTLSSWYFVFNFSVKFVEHCYWITCSVRCDNCIQKSMSLFSGQCFWCWSFRSAHACEAYSSGGDSCFWNQSFILVDEKVPDQGPIAFRFQDSRSFPWSAKWKWNFYVSEPTLFYTDTFFHCHVHLFYIFFCGLVQSVRRSILCISCSCNPLQFSIDASK